MSEQNDFNKLFVLRHIVDDLRSSKTYMPFGTWLTYEREKRGISMKRLALKSGYTEPFLRLVEKGKRGLSLDAAGVIAQCLMIDKEYMENRVLLDKLVRQVFETKPG